MNETQFDHLTRVMGEGVARRGMLRALAGGGLTLGLLGWTQGQDAKAKNCKKINDKKKRKACLKKARGTTNQPSDASPPPPAGDLPPPPAECISQDPSLVCTAGCGTKSDNCGRAVTCPCPSGKHCLSNGSCARSCNETDSLCPGSCFGCPTELFSNAEGERNCVGIVSSCDSLSTCTSTSQCPIGTQCGSCLDPTDLRCVPLCRG